MPEIDEAAPPCHLDVDVVRSAPVPTQVVEPEPDGDEAPLGTLVGEFTVFGEWYEINSAWEGHFLERTAPGAFQKTITNRPANQSPVRVLLEHGFDPTVGDKPLGVPSVLEERAGGVYAETPLLDTSYNRDLAPALKAGAYGQSFRFRVRSDEWVDPESDSWVDTGNPAWADLPQRTITEVSLEELGPTVWPASPATNKTTGLRSATDQFYEQLSRRDHARYEAAVRSVRDARVPAPAAPVVVAEEEPARATEEKRVSGQGKSAGSGSAGRPIKRSEEQQVITHPKDPKEGPRMSEKLTLEERAARIDEIDARLTDIDRQNEGAELRSDDQSEWDALSAERGEHARAIEAQKRRNDYLQSLAENPGAHESTETEVRRASEFRAKAPAVQIKQENIYDTAAIRQKASSLDEAHRLYGDHAKRAIEVATFPGVSDRSKAQEAVSSLLERVDDDNSTMALRLLRTGSQLYDRAFGKAILAGGIQGLSPEEHRALSLGTDAAGGYAVPFQLDPTVILTSNGTINPLRNLARVVQITGKVWEGLTSAGITVSRSAEAAEADDNSPSFNQPTVGTTRVDGFVPFSYELEYSWAQLRQEITYMLSDAKDIEEATSFTTGSGTGVNPQGVLTGATTSFLTASGTALARHDLEGVVGDLPPRFRARAQWLANVSFYNAVRELSNGFDIWAPLEGAPNRRLLGYTTNESSELPKYTGAVNGVDAIFGDFSQFIIVDRIGMNVELIPQVFGANQRPTGQRGIFATWFNGSKVLVPNAFRVLKQAAA